MSTRVQPLATIEPAEGEAEPESLAATADASTEPSGEEAELAVKISQLVDALNRAGDSERAFLATQLNEALGRVRGGPGARAQARAVLALFEEHWLRPVADGSGALVRAEAVSALLRLGYPWALQIDPDDLVWFRAQPVRKTPTRLRRWVFIGLVAVALALYLPFLAMVVPQVAQPFVDLVSGPRGVPVSATAAPQTPEPLEDVARVATTISRASWTASLDGAASPRLVVAGPERAQGELPVLGEGFLEVYAESTGKRVWRWSLKDVLGATEREGRSVVSRFRLPPGALELPRNENYALVLRATLGGHAEVVRSSFGAPPGLP